MVDAALGASPGQAGQQRWQGQEDFSAFTETRERENQAQYHTLFPFILFRFNLVGFFIFLFFFFSFRGKFLLLMQEEKKTLGSLVHPRSGCSRTADD